MEITPLGDSALIVRVVDNFVEDPNGSLESVLAALRHLEAASIPGVIELAPAYSTIGVFFDPTRIASGSPGHMPFDLLKARIEGILSSRPVLPEAITEPPLIEIPVCYGGELGPDLADVARAAGLDETEVIRRHFGVVYRVACIGFVPGFPFLSGLPAELATPRRATPRKQVPGGSVGIGGSQTGVYPGESPGGWNLIGRTPYRLFEVEREPPALLSAGSRVRFREISRMEFDALGS